MVPTRDLGDVLHYPIFGEAMDGLLRDFGEKEVQNAFAYRSPLIMRDFWRYPPILRSVQEAGFALDRVPVLLYKGEELVVPSGATEDELLSCGTGWEYPGSAKKQHSELSMLAYINTAFRLGLALHGMSSVDLASRLNLPRLSDVHFASQDWRNHTGRNNAGLLELAAPLVGLRVEFFYKKE